jgi:3-oxoacyl-[acyl-carrier protein] reductase
MSGASLNSPKGPLSEKKVVITGGSRGIGASIARVLAEKGAAVAISYAKSEESARKVLESLPGSGHFCFQLNIADEAALQDSLGLLVEKWGTPQGLVNNAGITKDNLLLRMKSSEFDEVIATNLKGSFLVTKFFLKTFLKAKSGSVVNITSVIGQTGNGGQANYAASKAGLIAFTKSAALEVANRGIRLNCVAPGFIATEMTEALTDEQKNQILAKIPMERIADGKEVAYAVAFLLSDEANYITGQTLNVNGGLYMG